ncbi:hypothetical protein [Bacteroides oleiciplenus]|uniref:hypothetical protein n=1 Tax=Bacteroides oleiciplenus TaxID=626931 RepID=UPI0015F3181B|nr:hypothetical protein [Bacteroides oleiciplenus]
MDDLVISMHENAVNEAFQAKLFDLPPVVSFVFALIASYALVFMSKKTGDLTFKMQWI